MRMVTATISPIFPSGATNTKTQDRAWSDQMFCLRQNSIVANVPSLDPPIRWTRYYPEWRGKHCIRPGYYRLGSKRNVTPWRPSSKCGSSFIFCRDSSSQDSVMFVTSPGIAPSSLNRGSKLGTFAAIEFWRRQNV
jgi:hypothetical protein